MRWRTVALDLAVAATAFALSAGALATAAPASADVRDPDVAAYALVAVYSASAALRRWNPVAAVATALGAGLAFAAAGFPTALTPVGLLPVYTAAVELPSRRARFVLGAAVVASALGTTFGPGATNPGVPAVVVSVWLLGRYVGERKAYTAELERKNRLLEQARLELADRAVTEERLRIARELHDVVAHTMSVVAVHAGTGRMVAEQDPAAARQALATIETATRSALSEMRRLLGVLRSSDGGASAALSPAPGLGDLDALVAAVGTSGAAVEVRVEGERNDVPPGVDLSAFRIVQEALTNVVKHAGPARVAVAVRYDADAVTVEVEDDGDGRAPAALERSPDGGHGLAGMRERVAIHDGELEAGPRPADGFRVAARLPYRAQAWPFGSAWPTTSP